jgi:hypothetical protein
MISTNQTWTCVGGCLDGHKYPYPIEDIKRAYFIDGIDEVGMFTDMYECSAMRTLCHKNRIYNVLPRYEA